MAAEAEAAREARAKVLLSPQRGTLIGLLIVKWTGQGSIKRLQLNFSTFEFCINYVLAEFYNDTFQVIAAEGEQKASRALKEASEVIQGSSSALQLRYLQTLNNISAEKNSTIIFPLPIDMFSHFMKAKEKVA